MLRIRHQLTKDQFRSSLDLPHYAPHSNKRGRKAELCSIYDIDKDTPDVNLTTPDVNLTMPDVNLTTPDVNLTTPDVNLTTPDVNLTTPDANLAANLALRATRGNIKRLVDYKLRVTIQSSHL
jgi:hypothetical protein